MSLRLITADGTRWLIRVATSSMVKFWAVRADVEDLLAHDRQWRLERCEDSASSVIDVHEGAPLVAADDGDLTVDQCLWRSAG